MTLDSVLNTIMPWIVGLGVIGFFIWLFKEPFKLMFGWARDLLGYGKENIEDGFERTTQIVYK